MVQATMEELGPIDYVVIESPAGSQNFTGAVVRELASLVEAELIRVLDVLIIAKDADGEIEAFEFEDLEDVGELGALEAELAEILALEDVENLAAAMEPGTYAGVIVWENSWAAPFAVAARESGGQLIANGRIPTQALIASLEEDEDSEGD